MKFPASLMYTKKILFSRQGKESSARRSLIGAMLCIGISLIPLVAVMTISNGMIEGMTARMIGLSSSDLMLGIPSYSTASQNMTVLDNLSDKIKNVDGVLSVYPEIQGTALAAGNSTRTGASVRAVDFSIFTQNKSFKDLLKVTSGSIPTADTRRTAIIGKKIADTIGIKSGDKIRLITTQRLKNGRIIPHLSVFTVAATVSSGYEELDALWVFIPFESGMSLFSNKSSTMSVMIETSDPFSAKLEKIADQIQSAVGEEFPVYCWNELNTNEFQNFASTKMMLLFIMMLIVLVASVNISSALVMLVMERRYEIAILKSLGGTSGGITLSFLLTGLATGMGGVLFGVPLGLLFSVNINKLINFIEKAINFFVEFMYLLYGHESDFVQIHLMDPAYYIQNITVSIPFEQLFLIVAGTLILSLAVSAIPSINAGKEKPLEILRKI